MDVIIPLAERMRPDSFENYVGQKHLIGENGVLRRFIDNDTIPSFILWGAPGIGKTTLAGIVAKKTNREFMSLSAVTSGVKDVREAIDRAKESTLFNQRPPILFIDEIHRFSKAQQDSLLGAVEKGVITLIGATTENPSFEVISPLLSRCAVYTLNPLSIDDMKELVDRALNEDIYLSKRNITIKEYEAMLRYAGGDARKLLGIVEILTMAKEGAIEVTNDFVIDAIKQNIAIYDKNGEMHYDIISAFIKSVRGSDPNAAIYYLAKMISGGEEPKFIARRLVILAAEDIGLANPNALLIANACFETVRNIGMPEGRIPLAEATIYLATSPKSNSAYMAINEAISFIEKDNIRREVPLNIRNAPTKLMKELGYGDNYKYSHSYDNHFAYQEFMPEGLENKKFYTPANNSKERAIGEYINKLWGDKYDK